MIKALLGDKEEMKTVDVCAIQFLRDCANDEGRQ